MWFHSKRKTSSTLCGRAKILTRHHKTVLWGRTDSQALCTGDLPQRPVTNATHSEYREVSSEAGRLALGLLAFSIVSGVLEQLWDQRARRAPLSTVAPLILPSPPDFPHATWLLHLPPGICRDDSPFFPYIKDEKGVWCAKMMSTCSFHWPNLKLCLLDKPLSQLWWIFAIPWRATQWKQEKINARWLIGLIH